MRTGKMLKNQSINISNTCVILTKLRSSCLLIFFELTIRVVKNCAFAKLYCIIKIYFNVNVSVVFNCILPLNQNMRHLIHLTPLMKSDVIVIQNSSSSPDYLFFMQRNFFSCRTPVDIYIYIFTPFFSYWKV